MAKAEQSSTQFEEFLKSYHINRNKPVKTLLWLYKGNIGKLLISLLFFIVKNSPVWVMPIVTANIINIATHPDQYAVRDMIVNIAVVLAVIIQNVPTNVWHVKYFSQAIRYVEAGLRSTLVRKLQQLSIAFHKELMSGRLQTKIIRDVENIEFLSRQVVMTFLATFFNIGVAITVVVTKNLTVALFFVLALPISLTLITFFRKNMQSTTREFRKEIEEMSSKVSEMVEMIPVTRAHGLEEVEIDRIDSQLMKVRDSGYRLDILTAFFGASNWVTFQVFQVICLAFTGYLAYRGQISVGEVILYQGYFGSILNQITNIINIYPNVAKGIESVKSVGEILLADDIEDNRGKARVRKVEGAISFRDVGFSYSNTGEPVIRDLNLDVAAGECIAFVGESGAGKTTILNLITGLYKPTKGEILLDGADLNELDLRSYRQFLAVVPQNTILFSGSIRDNITYGLPSVTDTDLETVLELANLTDVVRELPDGVDTLIGEHGGRFSGGQRQRIAIARAMMRDPRVIVLDEATSALDTISESRIQTAMQRLMKGRTTFIVAHRLSTIRNADRIAVIKNGSCIECGTYGDLMVAKGAFYHLEQIKA